MPEKLVMEQPNYNDSKYNVDLSPVGAIWGEANLALHVNPPTLYLYQKSAMDQVNGCQVREL